MRKFNFRLLAAFIALTLFSAYTTLAVTSRTSINKALIEPQGPMHSSRLANTTEDGTPPTEGEEGVAFVKPWLPQAVDLHHPALPSPDVPR